MSARPGTGISLRRLWAVMVKELAQMRRDRLTFALMIGVPIIQLLLFGFAINTDPRSLPTAVLAADAGPLARSFVRALENSGYFRVTALIDGEAEADELLAGGDALFVVTIPPDFDRQLARGERPVLLVEVDATDPVAAGNAVGALPALARSAFDHDLVGPLAGLRAGEDPVELRIHRRYNPEGITRFNIVPGLMGVVLTITMVMMTALAMTRERERGTMEALLATPARPVEVMAGKILPYIGVGYVQVAVILVVARLLFDVPMLGDLGLLSAVLVVFIAANLSVGFTFSTFAQSQLQAMQMSFFFFLPSIMLSGFMFPFPGMPEWAQAIGEALPLTHFLRVVRGVMLKGNAFAEVMPHVLPLLAFLAAALASALLRYRRTLD